MVYETNKLAKGHMMIINLRSGLYTDNKRMLMVHYSISVLRCSCVTFSVFKFCSCPLLIIQSSDGMQSGINFVADFIHRGLLSSASVTTAIISVQLIIEQQASRFRFSLSS